MNVTSVNKRYIYYCDGSREKATEKKLMSIMDDAKKDTAFYHRMYEELNTEYIRLRINLKFGKPSEDHDNYFERVGALSGISDIMKKVSDKELHATQIETKCQLLLGIERPNIFEMYPEIIIEMSSEESEV